MKIIDDVKDAVTNTYNGARLKLATSESLSESDAIKIRVREKMARVSTEQANTSGYSSLLDIHNQIEANHDKIYHRPDNGNDKELAKEECAKILFEQEKLEDKFNVAYAELTGDPSITEENNALQTSIKLRDAEASAEQIKDDAIAKAKQAAEDAKEQAGKAGDTISDKADDLGKRAGNAAEDVKEAFTSSKPRP